MTGKLMKPVDVLGDECSERAAPFERHKCAVAAVRLRAPGRMFETPAPRQLSDLRIRHVVVNVGQTFRFRVTCPDALRATKVRDTGFR